VLKTPVGAPKANAYCERLIGSLRRECLDWFIPLNERHVRQLAREWMIHYNRGRPHLSLGPGIPVPEEGLPATRLGTRKIPEGFELRKKPIFGGLHHEYRPERMVA
jgi:transposase InsO family protein